LLPDWRWEAYERETEDVYRGRVKSPNTYGTWEYGSFTQDGLETAGAYRIDTTLDDDDPVYPDGGYKIESSYRDD